jgi:glutamate-1-semialdehyde 2,1-aminomutase
LPEAVQELTLKFEYNNLQSLERLFAEHPGQTAAVIMEPVNFHEPKDGFLEKVRDLAHANGALLIFDEIITGFRMAIGGAQAHYGVIPDLATFGKAMGNGMPISAVVGKMDYMQVFDDIFFSFTYGGELASIAASIATINTLRESDGLVHIAAMGARLKIGYQRLIEKLQM